MRRVWWLAFGLVATAAACGGGDDDVPGDGNDGGSPSSSSGGSSNNGSSSGSGSGSSSGGSSGSGSGSSSSSSSGSSGASSGDPDGGAPDGDAGEQPDSSGDAGDAGPVFEYTRFDLNHLLLAGQSNALGIGGGAVLDTVPRGGAACSAGTLEGCSGLMFGTGTFPTTGCVHYHVGCTTHEARTTFLPLVEGDRFDNAGSAQLQSPASPLANQAAALAASRYFPGVALAASGVRMLVSNHARSGNAYGCIRKGSCPSWFGGAIPATTKTAFEDGIDQVRNAKLLAEARGWSYAVRGVFVVHGEGNHDLEANYQQNEFPMPRTGGGGTIASYKEALLEWQHDYQTAITAETGQAVDVPMYITQMTNWTWISGRADGNPNSAVRSVIPIQQLAAFREAPEKIILVTPTYPFPFNDVPGDKVHLTPAGSRRVGEYFGKAYAETTFSGRPWQPLYPLQVTRAGAVIRIRFHVPVLPLVLDTVSVTDPNGMYGFRYVEDGGAPAAVQSVAIDGDSVVVTLTKPPAGGNRRIRYAYDGVPGNAGGPTSGPRGNLRDSDATASTSGGGNLVNWSVAFDEAVP